MRLAPETDFLVFLFWTRWIGRLNVDHIKKWEQQCLDNEKANIQVVKINLDVQEHWGPEKLKKLETTR